MHAFDRQTDRQTDGWTGGRTAFASLDRVCIPSSAVKTAVYNCFNCCLVFDTQSVQKFIRSSQIFINI